MSPRDAHLLVSHSPAQEEESSGAVAPPFDPAAVALAASDILARLMRASYAMANEEHDLAMDAMGEIIGLRDEVTRLRIAVRAVRADPTCAAQIIRDALREGEGR